jgi:hypothetical protein
MTFHPRAIAEQAFKMTSAEAALFELRMHLRAGAIPATRALPIDSKLSCVLDAFLKHYRSVLSAPEVIIIEKACALRNKLLHCEFSAARQRLNELNPQAHAGGVIALDVAKLDPPAIINKLDQITLGQDTGQSAVANTKTRKLSDVFGWLLESQGAGEFDEAARVFREAMSVLDRLSESKE